MDATHLQDTYRQLRQQLDAAYAAPVWDSERIDGIADRMIPLEAALASARALGDVRDGDGA